MNRNFSIVEITITNGKPVLIIDVGGNGVDIAPKRVYMYALWNKEGYVDSVRLGYDPSTPEDTIIRVDLVGIQEIVEAYSRFSQVIVEPKNYSHAETVMPFLEIESLIRGAVVEVLSILTKMTHSAPLAQFCREEELPLVEEFVSALAYYGQLE
jgi:hypothetical protein